MSKKIYTLELKVEVAQRYALGNISFQSLSEEYHISKSEIIKWYHVYSKHGVSGLYVKNGTYTGDFKVSVVEYMHNTGISMRKTAVHFKIPSFSVISKWDKIYREEGKYALYEERKGRSTKLKNITSQKVNKNKEISGSEELDLVKEVKRLQMENDYLKKLNTLIQERKKLNEKTK